VDNKHSVIRTRKEENEQQDCELVYG